MLTEFLWRKLWEKRHLEKEIGYEDWRWIELAQDHVQWWIFALAALNHRGLL
jgi:hypothetical protein